MEQKTPKPTFVQVNRNPFGLKLRDMPSSAIQAVSIAIDIPWKDAFLLLYQQAHALCIMPQDTRSVQGMLKACGFFRQPNPSAGMSLYDLIADCNANFTDGEIVIAATYGYLGAYYIPITPQTVGDTVQYVYHGDKDPGNRTLTQIWIRWRDGQEHSVKKRRTYNRKTTQSLPPVSAEDKDGLHAENVNPAGNRVGDCVVRGIAGVLDVSWHDALDMLAEASGYAHPMINYDGIYDMLLKKQGFEKHDPLQKNGRLLTGAEFCQYIKDMYPAGTRIFAHVGRSHVVAILVIDHDYKIIDSWDSTDHKIGWFWTKYPERKTRPAKQTAPAVPSEAGQKVRHPQYGIGVIEKAEKGIMHIRFESVGVKVLSADWVKKNLKIAE